MYLISEQPKNSGTQVLMFYIRVMNDIAIIFDMDGVICHTNPFHALAFREFFKRYNITPTEEEFEEHMYGKHNSYIIEYFFKRKLKPGELIELENQKEGLFREIYKDHIQPTKGFLGFLDSLKEAKVKTAIATSAPKANLDLIADDLNLKDKMQSILFSEAITKHKPDPEIYLKSASNLQIPAERCIVFEDSHSGVSAGLAAGMKVCGVLTSHTKDQLPQCDMYIHDFLGIELDKLYSLI